MQEVTAGQGRVLVFGGRVDEPDPVDLRESAGPHPVCFPTMLTLVASLTLDTAETGGASWFEFALPCH